jgi:hypothetical protein
MTTYDVMQAVEREHKALGNTKKNAGAHKRPGESTLSLGVGTSHKEMGNDLRIKHNTETTNYRRKDSCSLPPLL